MGSTYRSCHRPALAAALIIAGLLASATVGAQAAGAIPLSVATDASGCVTERALRARLEHLRVQGPRAEGLRVRVDAASEPVVLQVLRDGAVIATRRFEALPARCGERLETLAVVIALAIEHAVEPPPESAPPAGQPVPPPNEPNEPVAAAPAEPAPPSPPPAEPAAEASSDADAAEPGAQPVLRTVVAMGGAYGLLPELAGLASVSIEVPGRVLLVGLGALASTETRSELAGGTASAQIAGARGYGCFHGAGAALDLQACAGLALGVVIASGLDYARTQDATGTLLSPLIRLAARYPAGGTLSFGLALDCFLHLVRPELQVSGRAGSAATVPLFGAGLAIEAALALP